MDVIKNINTYRAVRSVLVAVADGNWHFEDDVASRSTSIKMATMGLLTRNPGDYRRKTTVRITEAGQEKLRAICGDAR